MAEIYKEGRENIIRRHIRVRNLLASVALAMGHYTLLDRLNNAVSIDAVQKTIYEAARIVETLIKQGKVKEEKREIRTFKKNKDIKITISTGTFSILKSEIGY
jgi:CRISPR-associated protein (Cas_Csa5).